ncbi:hypothetical protein [Amycolatopsis sp. H20-H5]|uniref:hypothetical protein n=1 Tax=Amycolatopsis sp. H20-H5 TaxID=3046309 RepID=UPI002DB5A22F|nr:hypothetical protein [Amycolatopsis sp. H20-H5]MEC3973791.1 hypothetical protein [Amycolatopsis sp. H20-H5]
MTAEAPGPPRYRAILALDIEGSTARTNTAKAQLRAVMYRLLEEALSAGGITECLRDPLVDRGDGVLALIRPADEAPKTALLNPVIPVLSRLLSVHSAQFPELGFRLRAVIHAGEIHFDSRGCFGEALDVAFRLLDAPAVKEKLELVAGPVVLVVSDEIYQRVVKHGYDGIDGTHFESLVRVSVGGTAHSGWVHVPDDVPRAGSDVIPFFPRLARSSPH